MSFVLGVLLLGVADASRLSSALSKRDEEFGDYRTGEEGNDARRKPKARL
jgi:hypothetical protein